MHRQRTNTRCRIPFVACRWITCTVVIIFCSVMPAICQVKVLGTQSVVAQSATMSPAGVASDANGNLYISDTQTRSILCLTSAGVPCGGEFPVQGGMSRPTGIVMDGAGDLFVVDPGSGSLFEIPNTPAGYGSIESIASSLDDPEALALDPSGNLFVAATGSGEILELKNSGGHYAPPVVVLQNLSTPGGIAIDKNYTMYISQQGLYGVSTATIVHGAYGAPQLFARVPSFGVGGGIPGYLTIDSSLNLYITDITTGSIICYGLAPGVPHPTSTYTAGHGFTNPGQVAIGINGFIYIADTGNNRVVSFNKSILPFASTKLGQSSITQSFVLSIASGTTIESFHVFSAGNANADFELASGSDCSTGYYASAATCGISISFHPMHSGVINGGILITDDSGVVLANIYLYGTGLSDRIVSLPANVSTIINGLQNPTGVTVDGSGNVFVADSGSNEVYEYKNSGGTLGPQTTLPIYALNDPIGLAVDGSGNLFIASSGNDRVIKFFWNGNSFVSQTEVGTGMYVPSGVAVAPNGTTCIANTYENLIPCYAWNGNSYSNLVSSVAWGAASPFSARFPLSTAIDASENIYTVQPYANQVTEIRFTIGTTVNIGSGTWKFPNALAMDGEGDLYVLDSGNNRVMMLIPNGTSFQTAVLVASGFNAPQGMAVDSSGNLYVADTGNHRIVKITMSQPAPLQFTNATAGSTNSKGINSIQIFNLGSQSATINNISFPADFTSAPITTSSCVSGTILTQGKSCSIAAKFLPQSASGTFNETITYTVTSGGGSNQTYSIPTNGESNAGHEQTIMFHATTQATYGQNSASGMSTVQLTATSSSGLPVAFSVLSGPGSIASGSSLLQVLGAGTITIQASQAGNQEYAAAQSVEQAISVLPAVLTVTASSRQIIYGQSVGSCGYTINGFVLGDSAENVVSGNPQMNCGSSNQISVGVYPIQISQGTLSAANYQFTFVAGTLTVTPAILQVIPNNISIPYGTPMPELSYRFSGFIGSDSSASLSGYPVLTTGINGRAGVGSYPINCQVGALHAINYTFVCQGGTLSITQVPVTIVPNTQSMVYGSPVPLLTYSLIGLVQGDTTSSFEGSPVLSTSSTSRSPVGSYPIACSPGTMHSVNYSVSCSTSEITVTKAQLTVSAENINVIYGSQLPAVSYSYSGFVNDDVAANAVRGNPSVSCIYTAGYGVGSYPILVTGATLASTNYSFIFQPATLTVFKATLYLAPNSLSVEEGSPIPPLTYTAYGLINGETMASALTGYPSITTTATSSSAPGQYPIVMLPGSLNARNYTVICMNRILAILPSSAGGNNGSGGGIVAPVRAHGQPLLPGHDGMSPENVGYGIGIHAFPLGSGPAGDVVSPESTTSEVPGQSTGSNLMLPDGQSLPATEVLSAVVINDSVESTQNIKLCNENINKALSSTLERSYASSCHSDFESCNSASKKTSRTAFYGSMEPSVP